MCVSVNVLFVKHEDILRLENLSFQHVGPGFKLRLPGLAARAYIDIACWVSLYWILDFWNFSWEFIFDLYLLYLTFFWPVKYALLPYMHGLSTRLYLLNHESSLKKYDRLMPRVTFPHFKTEMICVASERTPRAVMLLTVGSDPSGPRMLRPSLWKEKQSD